MRITTKIGDSVFEKDKVEVALNKLWVRYLYPNLKVTDCENTYLDSKFF